MMGFTPVPFLFGRGTIDGRTVVVAGDDFTVRGGSADMAGKRKQEVAEQMARELRLPIIRLIDGSGGGGSVKTYEQTGFTYVPANPAWDDVVANLRDGAGGVAGAGQRRGAGRGARGDEPLFDDRQGHGADVHGGAAGREADRRGFDEGGTRRQLDPRQERRGRR